MEIKSNLLGDLLLEAGLIDQFQLESALSLQRNLGGQIGAALIKLGYLPEDTILEFLESQQRYARISLDELIIDATLMELLSVEQMRKLRVIPVELHQRGNEKTLRVAMTDPTNLRLIEDLQFLTGCKVLPLLAPEEDILQAIEQNASSDPLLQESIKELGQFFQGELAPQLYDSDPRLDRLLDILMEKGVLSKKDVERVNNV